MHAPYWGIFSHRLLFDFSWRDTNKELFTPDRAPTADQGNDATQV